MGVIGVMLVVGVVGGITTLAVWASAEAQRWQSRFVQDWEAAARAAGLQAWAISHTESRADGALEGVATSASLKLEREGKTQVFRCRVWAGSRHIPRSLSLQPDSVLRSMSRWVDGADLPIGDPVFDDRIELPSIDARVCAALNAEARRRLMQLSDWGVYVRDGQVVSSTSWTSDHHDKLQPLLRTVALTARLLGVAPDELPQRLAHNALTDPAPGVRLQNLRFLVAPETRTPPALVASTATSLLADESRAVRQLAAEHAGAQGHAMLRAIAADPSVEIAERMRAVQSLARGPLPDVEGLRALLVEGGEPLLMYTALGAVDATASAALLDRVLRCTESEHESVRAAAARALGVVAQPETEPVLLRLLPDPSSDVQQASAEALGAFGSVLAVEPLLPLAQGLIRPRVRQAARAAIGRIQARLGDVEAGRLSLGEPQELAGAVDVVDAARGAGALSLAERQPEAGSAGRAVHGEHESDGPAIDATLAPEERRRR